MKYFLYYHNGSLNRGCEAIVNSTIRIIRKYDNNAAFILSSFNAETDRFDGVEVTQFRTRSLGLFERINAYIRHKLNGSEVYAIRKMVSPVVTGAESCNVCLSIGGDTYCYGDNRIMQVLTKELKNNGKKVILWGASVGEQDLDGSKLESIGDFDAVFARESMTYNLLKEKQVNNNISLFADPAFCLQPVVPEKSERRKTIGINISPLVCKINPGVFSAAEGLIEYITENSGLDILLVPHVTEDGNNDYETMRPLYDKFLSTGRVFLLPANLTAAEYKGHIAGLSYFIGARTHATIAAYSSLVPTLVLGYSVKSFGIARDLFGKDNYVLDVNDVSCRGDLITAFESLRKNEPYIRRRLEERIPAMITSAEQMGAELIKIASAAER